MDPLALRHILCPTDFGDLSTLALAHAARLAERAQARLTVLYADLFLPPREFTAAQADVLARSLQKERAAAERALRRYVAEHVPENVAVDTVVATAWPADAILAEADRRKADVVVMGTHGRSGLNRLVMGSVTERVLNEARTPVLAVRPSPATAAPGHEVRRILVPTDFSPAAHAALLQASGLSQLLGAELVVAHVTTSREREAGAQEQACAWVPEEVRVRCSLRHLVRHGDPADEILAATVEEGIDLIVLGARRRRLFDLSVWGTTTERVVRHAPAPVWVVPATN
ncbi:MAG: universal stress protein [Armatimonadota bacterium]|nr:universal stress protein [Armatimonadota bacterium]